MVDRRTLLLGAPLLMAAAPANAPASGTAWDFAFDGIEGDRLDLADFRGQVLLVTNTASFCGFTRQYEALQRTHEHFRPRGFAVIGVPSGDFNQESADNATVKEFCEVTFGIDFPMSVISHVRGDNAHPFYRWVRERGFGEPRWNFNKVLVGRDGQVRAMFASADTPDGDKIRGAIEQALALAA